MPEKRFRDPIYGYIAIDLNVVARIIDTACFQRLRNIRQTSYAPLYSSALHNRFIHSIGVYHLGRMVADNLKQSVPDSIIDQETKKQIVNAFELACLLHDVGHSPFSHSGEKFYMTYADIDDELKKVVNDVGFSDDVASYVANKKVANPHETVSAIVAIRNFGSLIGENNYDFFARCITGYKYNGNSAEDRIKNCFISMLNSDVIDVDKLDYLIRDSYVTGYDNVNIDYERLLTSISISNDEKYQLIYHKNALSVIENVVYARDAEKKWIQNHPSVLYEIFLIQHAIKKINDVYERDDKHLFCYEALTEQGLCFPSRENGSRKVSLLSDDDIVTISKNEIADQLTKEYFARDARRHPVWKSEAEYQSLFRRMLGEELLDRLELDMEALSKFIEQSEFPLPVINDDALKFHEKRIEEIQKSTELDEETKKENIQGIRDNLKWFYKLKRYSDENNLKFDYVIIMADIFHSGFSKKGLEELQIYFPEFNKTNCLKDVTSLFKLSHTRDNYFYIFYRRKVCDNAYACDTCKNPCKIEVSRFTKFIRDNIEDADTELSSHQSKEEDLAENKHVEIKKPKIRDKRYNFKSLIGYFKHKK